MKRSDTFHTKTYQDLLLGSTPRNRSETANPGKYTYKQALTYGNEDRNKYQSSIQQQMGQRSHIHKRSRNLTSWTLPRHTHHQTDQRTRYLEYIPTTNSEISHPGEQTPKQIRDLIISDTTQRSLKPHTWYIHPWTETSYTATYSHKPHFGDIYTQKAQEPCILGCTPINSSERWYSGTQIPPSSKSLKWYLDIDSTETSHLRDSVAQTALPPNTLDADSGHVGDVWD